MLVHAATVALEPGGRRFGGIEKIVGEERGRKRDKERKEGIGLSIVR